VNDRALDVPYIYQDLYKFSDTQNHLFIFGAYSNAHHKNRPVPLFNDGVQHDIAKSITTPLGNIGTPICFDCDHEAIIRKMVADGANAILVPSLDATHWSKRQHLQHAELFRHRAAENRRWISVAASSGLTQIIDPYGNRIQKIAPMTEGFLIGKFSFTEGKTIYNRFGWLIGYICLGFTSLFLLQRIIVGTVKKIKH